MTEPVLAQHIPEHWRCSWCQAGRCLECASFAEAAWTISACWCIHAYRVLVTASRSWTLRSVLYAALDDAEHRAHVLGYRRIIVVQGRARGGDRMSGDWAGLLSALPGMTRVTEEHPVPSTAWRYRRNAGHIRNEEMVSLGAHACLAFLCPCDKEGCPERGRHSSHGASGCRELAQAAGIPVTPYPSG